MASPSLLARLGALLTPPADRRMAEAWEAAPKPSLAIAPFAPGPQTPSKAPPISWVSDQPAPPPSTFSFRGGYNDHTYRASAEPVAYEGFGLDRIRNAVAQHRLGYFYESYDLSVALLGFAPVLAALQQAIAPILALPRHVRRGPKGSRGLARVVADEVEEQLVPRNGLLPSPYLPPTTWGTLAIYLRMMGFAVLQHVDGDPDPETGARPRYTRIWEPWATQRTSMGKWLALTTEGNVEIKNDGKFTLVADEVRPHLTGAVVALGEEVLAGKLAQEARNSWIYKYGNPKWVATLPEKVATQGEAGNAFLDALETIIGPDGFGALPYGSTFATVGLNGQASSAFGDAIANAVTHISMVLLGSDGTISAGGDDGAGPYRAPGFWKVRHDLIARPTTCIVRGLNEGHVRPYCDFNYAAGIERDKARGTWEYPALEIPLPDPEAEERIASIVTRNKALTDQIVADRAAGVVVDEMRVEYLAKGYEVEVPVLVQTQKQATITVEEVTAKLFAPDEYRAQSGREALPDDAGSVKRLAEERLKGGDEAGALAKVEVAEVNDENDPDGGPPVAPQAAGVVAVYQGLRIGAYSDDQERAPDGKFGSGSGGKGAASGNARKSSEKAHKASDKADRDGSHGVAQKAHRDAAGAHRDAAATSRKPEHKKAHADAAKAHDDKADEHAGKDPPLGGAAGGKGKASKAAQSASKSASAASSAAKAGGSHEDAATAHADAAKAHQEASKAARSEAHKKAHADAAKAHQRAATAHRAESITDEAPKKSEEKPARSDEKKWSKGAAGKLAKRRSDEADASSKGAVNGGSYEHSDAMFAHQDAESSHKRAAAHTSSASAKKAHLEQAQIHGKQSDYHRAERHKVRAAEEAAKTTPARPDVHGDERDTIFGAARGSIAPGIHEETPRAVDAKPAAAKSVRDAIGHLPEPVQKALAHTGVKHESVMTLGESGTETAHLNGIPRGWSEGSDWSQVGGVWTSGKAYTALGASSSDHGGIALHEIGHAVDFAAGEGVPHSERQWFKKQYNFAVGHNAGSADDRLSAWAKDVGRGNGDYYRQPGSAGRQELFAELFRESYRSQKSRDMVDKHFPEYRKNMAKELHSDWSKRGAI